MCVLSNKYRNTIACNGSYFTCGRDYWLIAIFVYLEWLSHSGPHMWRNAMQSVKSVHIPRGLPQGHTSCLHI